MPPCIIQTEIVQAGAMKGLKKRDFKGDFKDANKFLAQRPALTSPVRVGINSQQRLCCQQQYWQEPLLRRPVPHHSALVVRVNARRHLNESICGLALRAGVGGNPVLLETAFTHNCGLALRADSLVGNLSCWKQPSLTTVAWL